MVEEENKSMMGESPNTILPKNQNRVTSTIIEDQKPYEPLPEWYLKIYVIVGALLLVGLISMIIYNYAFSLQYYSTLTKDVHVKESIADALDTLLISSHEASHYVFSGGNKAIYALVNVDKAISQLKDLIGLGQFIYQEMVKKQKESEMVISELMVDVKYFTSPVSTLVKSQTVTDATYQLALYLLEIYKNSNPLQNLPNNVLFVFNNCLNISQELIGLSEIFNSVLVKRSE